MERDDSQPTPKLPSSIRFAYKQLDLVVSIFMWPALICSGENEQTYAHVDVEVSHGGKLGRHTLELDRVWHTNFLLSGTYKIEGNEESLFQLRPEALWTRKSLAKANDSYWLDDRTLRLIFTLPRIKRDTCLLALTLRYRLGNGQYLNCSIGDGKVVWYSKGGPNEREQRMTELYPTNVPIEVTRWHQQLLSGVSIKKPSPQAVAKRAERRMQQHIANIEVELNEANERALKLAEALREEQKQRVQAVTYAEWLNAKMARKAKKAKAHRKAKELWQREREAMLCTIQQLREDLQISQFAGGQQEQTGQVYSGQEDSEWHANSYIQQSEPSEASLQQQFAAPAYAGHVYLGQEDSEWHANSYIQQSEPSEASLQQFAALAYAGHVYLRQEDSEWHANSSIQQSEPNEASLQQFAAPDDGHHHHSLMSPYTSSSSGHQYADEEGRTERAKRQRTEMATSPGLRVFRLDQMDASQAFEPGAGVPPHPFRVDNSTTSSSLTSHSLLGQPFDCTDANNGWVDGLIQGSW